MKKWLKVSALGAAIGAVSLAAWAGSITNLNGQSCGDSVGEWHFVNVQTPAGTPLGTLTAAWSSGNQCVVTADRQTGGVQHYYCTAAGTLTSASTNTVGYLRLSDFTCGKKCEGDKCEPPK
jgi:hypothetical protein